MTPSVTKAIALGPDHLDLTFLAEAIERGGGTVTAAAEAEALIWASPRRPTQLVDTLHDGIRWVQLPFAGIENYASVLDGRRQWTCGKGVYARPVAEMAMSLLLGGLRGIGHYARQRSWSGPIGTNLHDARVLILGGGGITRELIPLLNAFGCQVRVIRKHPEPMDGAAWVGTLDDLNDELAHAQAVVVALSLTPETIHVLGSAQFDVMRPDAWVVNVGRGRHIDTDALVLALQIGSIGGAGLDVTDPEPLPDDHPLWSLDNCIITPHIGNTPEMGRKLLAAAVEENVRRWVGGEPLLGGVSVADGY